MRYFVCAVRDRALDAFGTPFFPPSLGVAERSFRDSINDSSPNNTMRNHAQDFDLFHLGFYDDRHAVFEMLAHPTQIAVGKDCLKPVEPRA